MQNDDLLANATEVAGSKVLPPCVILGRLGRGGMGAVYRARHLNLGIDVAVKVLKPQMIAEDPSYIARFKREGESAAAISHQNVIRVFDRRESFGLHYIIMELVVGEDVRNRVRRKGPLSIGEAMQIVHDAAMGLGAAHALGIVHRDVKPDNLLIANTGQLKVADLGLAKPTVGSGASLMSAANQVMGTPSYMPPEQWESPAVGPPADVWALGATLWYLLTGVEAFDARDGNFPRVMKQIVLQSFPDVRKKRADVPDGVVAILAKATSNDPKERYADGNELAAAIEALGLPRTSLRERAPATEAQTMVSPSPKNLEQIKQWLREDNPTPVPAGSKSDITDAAPTPEPLPAGGTVVQPPPTPAAPLVVAAPKGRLLLLAAVLLLAGGAGYWAFVRNPNRAVPNDATTERLAEVARLEQQDDFAGAIVKLNELRGDQPSPALDKRLAGLYSLEADRLAATNPPQWRSALEQLRKATELDASLLDKQQALRNQVKVAAMALLMLDVLPGKVRRGADVDVRGTFPPDFDAVRELRLADRAVERDKAGSFKTTLKKITQRTDVAIGARLVDDGVVELQRKTLDIGEAIAFDAKYAKGEASERDLWFTNRPTIAVEGTLAEGARLSVARDEIPLTRGADGAFSCQVPVGKEGEEVEVTLMALEDGFLDTSIQLGRVLRLGEPAFTILSPTAGLQTDQVAMRIEIGVDRWTRRVRASRADRSVDLKSDGKASPPTFAGELRLVQGLNRFRVEATNVTGTVSAQTLDVTCNALPAAIDEITLIGGGTPRQLARGQRVFVTGSESLRVRVSGMLPVLELDGKELAIDTDVPLNGLTEGAPKVYEFGVGNELGPGEAWRVELVLDKTNPVIAITEPAESTKVPAKQPVKMRGTWKEASGMPTITIAGQAATVVADANAADSGAWTYELAGQEASRRIRIRAVDAAGNEFDLSYPLEVEPAAKPVVKEYPGFTSDAASANELGFPKRIVDKDTGIELVAVDFANDRPPKLYVGKTLVTEKQFDGTGGDTPKLRVTGRAVDEWLRARNRRLDLLTREEWQSSCQDNPDLPDAKSKIEWLKPPTWNDSSYPICKGNGRDIYKAAEALNSFAFRVVFRAP